jgi:hypothetical protein
VGSKAKVLMTGALPENLDKGDGDGRSKKYLKILGLFIL